MPAFCAAADVAQYLGVTFGSEQATQVDDLIARISEQMEAFANRSFMSAPRTEVRDGTGARNLLTRHIPITDVSSVVINGRAIPKAADKWGTGYWWTPADIVLNGFRFDRGLRNIEVAYTAGFSTVPGDIKQACIETAALAMKRGGHLDVSSKSLAGETISFVNADFGAAAKSMLNQHKRVAPL